MSNGRISLPDLVGGTSTHKTSCCSINDFVRLHRGLPWRGMSMWWWWRPSYHVDLGLRFLARRWGDWEWLPFGQHRRDLVSYFPYISCSFPFPNIFSLIFYFLIPLPRWNFLGWTFIVVPLNKVLNDIFQLNALCAMPIAFVEATIPRHLSL